jgi:amidase
VLAVQGPLARSAADIELLFDVVVGAPASESAGWRLELPAARADRLDGFRVAFMPPLPFPPASQAMLAAVEELAVFLRGAGATVGVAMPDVDPEAYRRDYLLLLNVITSLGSSREEREAQAAEFAGTDDEIWSVMGEGVVLDSGDLFGLLDRREIARQAWARFFESWDVLTLPTALDAAFPHATGQQQTRTLTVDDRTVPYIANILHPMWAVYTGQPSTAFPAGLNTAGLPLGLEAIGPYLGDRTTIAFARLLEHEWHAFTPPPGWA